MKDKRTITVYDKDYQFVGNIMYTHFIPRFTEEEFVNLITSHFPRLRGKRWYIELM